MKNQDKYFITQFLTRISNFQNFLETTVQKPPRMSGTERECTVWQALANIP